MLLHLPWRTEELLGSREREGWWSCISTGFLELLAFCIRSFFIRGVHAVLGNRSRRPGLKTEICGCRLWKLWVRWPGGRGGCGKRKREAGGMGLENSSWFPLLCSPVSHEPIPNPQAIGIFSCSHLLKSKAPMLHLKDDHPGDLLSLIALYLC